MRGVDRARPKARAWRMRRDKPEAREFRFLRSPLFFVKNFLSRKFRNRRPHLCRFYCSPASVANFFAERAQNELGVKLPTLIHSRTISPGFAVHRGEFESICGIELVFRLQSAERASRKQRFVCSKASRNFSPHNRGGGYEPPDFKNLFAVSQTKLIIASKRVNPKNFLVLLFGWRSFFTRENGEEQMSSSFI